jgi:hypothetical protein
MIYQDYAFNAAHKIPNPDKYDIVLIEWLKSHNYLVDIVPTSKGVNRGYLVEAVEAYKYEGRNHGDYTHSCDLPTMGLEVKYTTKRTKAHKGLRHAEARGVLVVYNDGNTITELRMTLNQWYKSHYYKGA